MKRLLLLLLALAFAAQGALAVELGEGLDVQVHSISCEVEEGNATHTRILVNMTLTNWEMQALDLDEEIQSELVFAGKYPFGGELCFGQESIDPLVQLEGSVAFNVPNMVASAPEEIVLTIRAAGRDVPVSLEALPVRRAGGYGRQFEGAGFDTPEEAALAYVQALKDQDVMGAISTFAIESFVENVDFEAYSERLSTFQPISMDYVAPVGNEYYTGIKTLRRLNVIAQNMSMGYLTGIWVDDFSGDIGHPVVFPSDDRAARIAEFRDALQQNAAEFALEDLEILGVADMEKFVEIPEYYYSEANLKNIARQAVTYGCDELRDVAVHLTIGGEDYLQFMQCMRYGDRWYNYNHQSNLSLVLGVDVYSIGAPICVSAHLEEE